MFFQVFFILHICMWNAWFLQKMSFKCPYANQNILFFHCDVSNPLCTASSFIIFGVVKLLNKCCSILCTVSPARQVVFRGSVVAKNSRVFFFSYFLKRLNGPNLKFPIHVIPHYWQCPRSLADFCIASRYTKMGKTS